MRLGQSTGQGDNCLLVPANRNGNEATHEFEQQAPPLRPHQRIAPDRTSKGVTDLDTESLGHSVQVPSANARDPSLVFVHLLAGDPH
jgi:hypothetical protein